jgi:hypothetical protein
VQTVELRHQSLMLVLAPSDGQFGQHIAGIDEKQHRRHHDHAGHDRQNDRYDKTREFGAEYVVPLAYKNDVRGFPHGY